MIRLKKRLKPLCYLEDGRLLAYCFSKFYILDPNTFYITKEYSVNLGFKEKYFSRIKLIYRLFRLGIRNAVQIKNDTIVIFVNKRFYELNLESMELKPGFVPQFGVRALNITVISGISGFDNMVVFGSYLSNQQKQPVNIYKCITTKKWDIIYTFPSGTINHIHNIVPDPNNSCVWIFTGDFNKASAIWRAYDNFKKVECVVSGEQIYRGCVAFPVNNGVLYATDSPFTLNSIRFLHNDGNKWVSKHILDINGPCIYGCKIKDKYVFSTSVEPDGRDMSLMQSFFSWKRGDGIRDVFSYVYFGSINIGFREIYKAEKDRFPFIFQFGTCMFPCGINNTENIVIEHIATKKLDCSSVVIPLEAGIA